MRDPSLGLLALSSPFGRPWHQLVLELAVLAASVLVLGRAIARARAGDRKPLFEWLVLTSYGVQMELVAFAFLHNYEHARFTVQLVDGQLPLYVTGLYGTFMCGGTWLAQRLGARGWIEALTAGLAMCLIDVPFDVAGVPTGWWRWLDGDPNLAFRWLGVPVTSYYWYLVFGAVSVGIVRTAWPRLEKRPMGLAALLALPLGTLVIVLGVLGFLPFHAIHALGLSEGAIVGAHIVLAAALALSVRGKAKRPEPLLVLAAGLVPLASFVALVVEAVRGDVADAAERIAWSALALLGLALFAARLPLRRPTSASAAVPSAEVLPGAEP